MYAGKVTIYGIYSLSELLTYYIFRSSPLVRTFASKRIVKWRDVTLYGMHNYLFDPAFCQLNMDRVSLEKVSSELDEVKENTISLTLSDSDL